LGVSAQVVLPDWVRGRGLALYTTVFFGCLAVGSAVWGEVAAWLGLATAHFVAAAGAVAAVPLTWRWKLQTGTEVDLSPSMHWPAPIARRRNWLAEGVPALLGQARSSRHQRTLRTHRDASSTIKGDNPNQFCRSAYHFISCFSG
jgi:hypothetical protein